MAKYSVHLRSRGDHLKHGLIKTQYHIENAADDVEAATLAKQQAREQFPDRDCAPWFADRVTRKD